MGVARWVWHAWCGRLDWTYIRHVGRWGRAIRNAGDSGRPNDGGKGGGRQAGGHAVRRPRAPFADRLASYVISWASRPCCCWPPSQPSF
eukprot:363826-Chlamydomonas_euryale.AAC.2